MVVKSQIACGVVECLGRMWKSGSFCDFTVIVEDKGFQCHRCVLRACSEFFHGLLNSEMKEQAEGCVTIPNITKPTMDVILNSIYTGEDGLTSENVIDVWNASNQLQISFMITECEDFVMENMNTDNYLAMYEQAKLFQSSVVIRFTRGFMAKNFEHFRQTETFLNLPLDILHSMVDSQHLVISSENLIVESILKWICFNPLSVSQTNASSSDKVGNINNEQGGSSSNNADNESGNKTRKGDLAKLLSSCRLYLCSPGFLGEIRCNKLVSSCRVSCSMIFDALMNKISVGRHHNCWPLQALPRLSSSSEAGFIYAKIFQYDKANVYFYNLNSKKEFFIVNLGFVKGINNLSMTVFDNELYCYNSDLYFLGNDKQWTKVNIPQKRFNNTKLLSYGDYIYASNAQSTISLHRVNMKNIKENNWSLCIDIPAQKEEHSLVSCGRYILLFTQNQQSTNISVTCYDPEKETKRRLDDIEGGAPGNIISFCVEKQVYILQDNGSLWKAVNCPDDTDSLDLQFVSKLWDFAWSVRGAAFYKDQLLLFGRKLPADSNHTLPASLPGVFGIIRIVQKEKLAKTVCPMFAQKSWQQELES